MEKTYNIQVTEREALHIINALHNRSAMLYDKSMEVANQTITDTTGYVKLIDKSNERVITLINRIAWVLLEE